MVNKLIGNKCNRDEAEFATARRAKYYRGLQANAARRLGISPASISAAISGRRPDLKRLIRAVADEVREFEKRHFAPGRTEKTR